MATISKKAGLYHVRIRKKGIPTRCRSFSHKSDAQRWAIETERSIQLGTLSHYSGTLDELLGRYASEMTPAKKSAKVELLRIGKIRRSRLGLIKVSELSSTHLAKYRDERLTLVTGSSVLKELALISHAISVAMREWGLNLPFNPAHKIRKPSANKPRSRRLVDTEVSRLLSALSRSRNIWVAPVVVLAIETAMRRGELLSLRWENVHLERRFVHLASTKNGEPRDVPLSPKACAVLQGLPRHIGGFVFPINYEGFKGHWKRACQRAQIEGLHFHDLRHEATSRLFEKGLNVMEVAAITGHKDVRMLQRYTHLKAEDLAAKLV